VVLNHRTFVPLDYLAVFGRPAGAADGRSILSGWSSYALEHGFKALIWTASKKEWTTLEFHNQRFEDYATPWEKSFSPLAGKQLVKVGKPFFPVVDGMGTVVAYISLDVKACYLHTDATGRTFYAGRARPRAGWKIQPGGEAAEVLLDVDGEALSVKLYDYPCEPSYLADLIQLAGAVGVGILRAGLKSLVRTAARRAASEGGARLAGLPPLLLSRAGKFAKGSGQKVTLYHGLGKDGRELLAREKAFRFSGPDDDFAKAVYVSRDPKVGRDFMRLRGGNSVAHADVKTQDLGRIVDVRPGGMHRELWEQYMNTPVIPKGETPAQIIASRAGHRGHFFDDFLKKNELQDVDTVIGPIGDAWTSGPAINFVSEQIAIRSDTVARAVARAFAESL
jgi:hypothetical protein